ncbi:MAG: hypothetical protein CMJ64_02010 [Planctomycetaceae bacterium]|nr:hypothetical protein [Planctomycetaceae bacterium]
MGNCFNADRFDDSAFRTILNLAPEQELKDWYALLGVQQFESDVAAIDAAILQRFALVQRYQVGSYEEQALALLDELGRDYSCLSDDQERSAYEQSLRGMPAESIDVLAERDNTFGQDAELEPLTDADLVPPEWRKKEETPSTDPRNAESRLRRRQRFATNADIRNPPARRKSLRPLKQATLRQAQLPCAISPGVALPRNNC